MPKTELYKLGLLRVEAVLDFLILQRDGKNVCESTVNHAIEELEIAVRELESNE